MIFEIKKTAIYQAIKWATFFQVARMLGVLAILGFILALGQVASQIDLNQTKAPLALSALCLLFAIVFFELYFFWKLCLLKPRQNNSLKQAKTNENINVAEFLNFEATKICLKAQATNLQSDALLFALLKLNSQETQFVFSRGQLDQKKLKQAIKQELLKLKENQQASFLEVILLAVENVILNEREAISVGDLLFALSQKNPTFEAFLIQSDFKAIDVDHLINWQKRLQTKREKLKTWWSKENLSSRGAVARDWVSTYTLRLDRFSIDLRERLKKSSFKEIVGHEQEVKLAERVLARERLKNVLIVGEPGTGRLSLVERIAQRAFSGQSGQGVNYKRILVLDIAQITSQQNPEVLLDVCFGEAVKAGNIILCVKDIHNFISDNPSLGVLNISALLAKYLSMPEIQFIGITSFSDFHTIVEKNSSICGLFEKVEVVEISERETLHLLENFVAFFEIKYKKLVGYRALKEILRLSGRYLPDLPFPDKALRLFDEAMSYLALNTKDNVLEARHIQKIVSEKSQVPLENLGEAEKALLLNLEGLIHKRMINQEEAVKEVANALRRARAEVNTKTGPIGGFLFLGPTGVGKTELSKTLSEIYFGSENNMIRLDMSEFQATSDTQRLIGTSQTPGVLSVKVRENPFSLLLLDELEKAHKDILNLFLQVLDEGWLTDGSGRRVDFRNNIIIATSNAGSVLIQEKVMANEAPEKIKTELMEYLIKTAIFRPEFINRFDSVVFFKPLGKPELLQIAQLMLGKLAKSLLDKGIKFEIALPLKEKIVELSYNPQYGAREMKRVLQDKVENVLAKAMLGGTLNRGQTVQINPDNFELNIC